MSGMITSGSRIASAPVSFGLVSASMTRAPARLRVERSAIDSEEPAIDCTSVVSVVRRDSTSPVRVTSKNVGSIRITRPYTALRTSATMRSPSQVTW